ncbi:MAG TPA: hypothetical protein VK395_00985 [Gemmataceae bacterium]|nr:hypothetical protein [Gemmataceae bacterium]
MAMVCPGCNDSFDQRLLCPRCGSRLEYETPRARPASSASTSEDSWQQTPWGRLFVGVLLGQGLYYVLRHLCTAGALVAHEEGAGGVWGTLTGLIVLQILQAVSILCAGMLTGAGQQRGFIFGAAVGMWNAVFFLIVQRWTGQALTAINSFGEPILQVAFGALGGLAGKSIWKPLPAVVYATQAPPTMLMTSRRSGPSLLSGPIAWTRVITGVALAVGGVMFADVIREWVIDASNGNLQIDTRLQADLVTWEIQALALLAGSAFAGATTWNGLKQGLAVGIGAGTLVMGIKLASLNVQAYVLPAMLLSAFALGVIGGWFGGQLLPPVYGNGRRRRMHTAPT